MARPEYVMKSLLFPVLLLAPLYIMYTAVFTRRVEVLSPVTCTSTKITIPRVVIAAHARGGSTLIGNIFKRHGNTMYWVEPDIYRDLYGVQELIMPNQVTHFTNGSRRVMPDWETQEYSRATQAMLDCNMMRIPLSIPIHTQGVSTHCNLFKDFTKCAGIGNLWAQYSKCSRKFLERSPQCNWAKHGMKPSSTCVDPFLEKQYETWKRSYAGPQFNDFTFKASRQEFNYCTDRIKRKVYSCAGHMVSKCCEATANIIKYVRVRLQPLLKIVDDDPTIRALLITRDPRSIVASRKSTFGLAPFGEDVVRHTITVCEEVLDDHLLWQRVKTNYNDRIMYIKYEDIISNPVNYTRIMYKHAGLEPSVGLLNWVKSQFSCSGKDTGNKLGTCRNVKDVDKFNAKWKKVISKDDAREIDNNPACRKIFSFLGYKLYSELPAV